MDNINKSCKRICLWSGPRNISTALMYSFAQRPDTKVIDEPLYAHYLSKTDAKDYHPGSEEVLAKMEHDGAKVIQEILGPQKQEVLFVKQMTHHLLDLNLDFLNEVVNVLLTRDPKDMLPSYAKQVKNPKLYDVGYALHIELINTLEKLKAPFIVLDSKRVLDDPEGILKKVCAFAGIPFYQDMLSWKAGSIQEDGVWAKYWYKSVHTSTAFAKYKPKKEAFPDHLLPLLEECQPYYEQLLSIAL